MALLAKSHLSSSAISITFPRAASARLVRLDSFSILLSFLCLLLFGFFFFLDMPQPACAAAVTDAAADSAISDVLRSRVAIVRYRFAYRGTPLVLRSIPMAGLGLLTRTSLPALHVSCKSQEANIIMHIGLGQLPTNIFESCLKDHCLLSGMCGLRVWSFPTTCCQLCQHVRATLYMTNDVRVSTSVTHAARPRIWHRSSFLRAGVHGVG